MVTQESERSFPCLVMFVSLKVFWHSFPGERLVLTFSLGSDTGPRCLLPITKIYLSIETLKTSFRVKESICFVTFPCPYWTSAPIKAKLNLIKLVLADPLRSARGSKLSSGEVLTYSDTILSSRKVQSNPRRSNEMHLCSKNGLHRI